MKNTPCEKSKNKCFLTPLELCNLRKWLLTLFVAYFLIRTVVEGKMKMSVFRKSTIQVKVGALAVSFFLATGCATEGVKTGLFGYGPNEVGETKGSFFTGFLNAQNSFALLGSGVIDVASLRGSGAPILIHASMSAT